MSHQSALEVSCRQFNVAIRYIDRHNLCGDLSLAIDCLEGEHSVQMSRRSALKVLHWQKIFYCIVIHILLNKLWKFLILVIDCLSQRHSVQMSRWSAIEVHGISLIRLVFRFRILFEWTFQSYIPCVFVICWWVIMVSSCEGKLNYFQLLVLHLHIFYFQRYHEMQKFETFEGFWHSPRNYPLARHMSVSTFSLNEVTSGNFWPWFRDWD